MSGLTIGSGRRHHEVGVLALGAMNFGTTVDERTAQAILDRFRDRGGRMIDTANNYAGWNAGDAGGQSERVLGRWLKGVGDDVVLATKCGARRPGGAGTPTEGLGRDAVLRAAEASLERLGRDRVELFYTHIDDTATPAEETMEALNSLVEDGRVDVLGASNHWSWKVERNRAFAASHGWAPYEVLQYHHTYFKGRTDIPGPRSPEGEEGMASGDLLSYVRSTPDLVLTAYSPLLGGAYNRPERLDPARDHAGTVARRKALDTVAARTGATVNQVVLAWLIGGALPVVPIVGPSSVVQLDELMDAVDLRLDTEDRRVLDDAY